MKNPISLMATTTLLAVCSLSAATHYVSLESTNPTPPYTNWVTAATNIQDAVHVAATNDVVLVSNGVYTGGAWAVVDVEAPLALLSVNGPRVTAIDGGGTNSCVSLTDGASLTGFTLTNGYAGGGGGVSCASTNAFLTNCLIVGNSATSAGGGVKGCTLYNCTLTGNSVMPFGTRLFSWPVNGGGADSSTLYNCTLSSNSAVGVGALSVYVPGEGGGASYSTLYNCTLTGNSCSDLGGGAEFCVLSNCTLTGNSSDYKGGGACVCTLYNCTLSGNSATIGGGVSDGGSFLHGYRNPSTLYNCTVVDNLALDSAGGVAGSTLFNSIVAYNAAWADDNYSTDSTLNYCCTVPLPPNGFGNISVPPQFVDYASGNLRLQPNSLCINAGNNLFLTNYDYHSENDTYAWFTNLFDMDGNPRIVNGTVDIGAYEYQGTGSRISYAWLQQYGLRIDGSADSLDPDHDALNNWQEWVCGTCPTNTQSALRLISATPTRTNVTVSWQSVSGVNYSLQCSTNLSSPFTLVATNIPGQSGTTTYTDTNAPHPGPFFYRVSVKCP
jgi:hypothetical protein